MSHEDKLTILETGRLVLRRIQSRDIPALLEVWTDPDVTFYMGGPRDRGQLQAEFANEAAKPFAQQYDLWPLIEKRTGRVVGHCGLLEKDVDGKAEIELVYVIARADWGKGFASEAARALIEHAFHQLRLKRLIALIEAQNVASEAVARRIGMRLGKETIRPGGELRKVYFIEAPEA